MVPCHTNMSITRYYFVVNIQDFEEQIWGLNPHRFRRRINIYTFDIFKNHCISVEEIDETNRMGFHLHHLEIGPLYLLKPFHLKRKEAVWNIASLFIPSNWWTGFSSWEDFFDREQTFQYTQS